MRLEIPSLAVTGALIFAPLQTQAQQICELPVSDIEAVRALVLKLPGATPADSRSPDIDVINVGQGQLWNFTKPNHPAHPLVACPSIVQRGGQFSVETQLECRPTKAQCDQLAADYARLDKQMQDGVKERTEALTRRYTPHTTGTNVDQPKRLDLAMSSPAEQ